MQPNDTGEIIICQTADGKTYQVDRHNLDAIISVSCRVNSKRRTQFRIWAIRAPKDHLLRGYSLNQCRLAEKGAEELRQVIGLLTATLVGRSCLGGRRGACRARDHQPLRQDLATTPGIR